jgi:ribosomal protein S8
MKETLISGINLGVKSNFFSLQVELNKKNLNILRYLYQNGLINSYSILKSNKKISLFFSYYYEKKPILYVKKISKSGRKIYVS